MKNNFILTMIIAVLSAIVIIAGIVYFYPPSDIFLPVVLLLIGFIANGIFALIYYRFATQDPFESEREVFRRCYKRGIVFGLLVVILLAAQIQFDLI